MEISRNGKILILAYDQGFEHGPVGFNELNVDPKYIFDIAKEGKFTAVAVHAGVAEKYYDENYEDIPLIVKLNGKTRFNNEDPVSLKQCSVKRAAQLGAAGVGYTIYLGSSQEQEMFREFSRICEEAHNFGMKAICWMYPRGPSIKDEMDTDTLAYAARIALELGADVVKLKYNGDLNAMKWVVKSAGRAKVVFAGGAKTSDEEVLRLAKESLEVGAVGLAIGRNVWQHENPLKIAHNIRKTLGL